MEMCWIPAPFKDQWCFLGSNPALSGRALTDPNLCFTLSADFQDFG